MTIEIGYTDEICNTSYAPIAALSAHYQQNEVFKPFEDIEIHQKQREFRFTDKLIQVYLSTLAGCRILSEVNTKLKPELGLARMWKWSRFADQSTLSRALDALSLKQIEQLTQTTSQIRLSHSQIARHNWRGYLWLDFDLTSLPCGPKAEKSQKGFIGDKKT